MAQVRQAGLYTHTHRQHSFLWLLKRGKMTKVKEEMRRGFFKKKKRKWRCRVVSILPGTFLDNNKTFLFFFFIGELHLPPGPAAHLLLLLLLVEDGAFFSCAVHCRRVCVMAFNRLKCSNFIFGAQKERRGTTCTALCIISYLDEKVDVCLSQRQQFLTSRKDERYVQYTTLFFIENDRIVFCWFASHTHTRNQSKT